MDLIVITNNPKEATILESMGVDRLMVDLETLGKLERQRGRPTWISDHKLADVRAVRNVLSKGVLVTRINPLHNTSGEEIDEVIALGADVLMLPMATTAREAKTFVRLVGGRVKTCLLLETVAALECADEITGITGLDEIHVGLNDLHLTLGMKCMFQVLADGLLDRLSCKTLSAGKKLGIGGVGAAGFSEIEPKLVMAEHVRLGSSMVILGRSFFTGVERNSSGGDYSVVVERVSELRSLVAELMTLPQDALSERHQALKENVNKYIRGLQSKL